MDGVDAAIDGVLRAAWLFVMSCGASTAGFALAARPDRPYADGPSQPRCHIVDQKSKYRSFLDSS